VSTGYGSSGNDMVDLLPQLRAMETEELFNSAHVVKSKVTFNPKSPLRIDGGRNILRQKELEVSRLKREVEALRLAAPLWSDEESGNDNKPRLAT
jgi:hypothetical protein